MLKVYLGQMILIELCILLTKFVTHVPTSLRVALILVCGCRAAVDAELFRLDSMAYMGDMQFKTQTLIVSISKFIFIPLNLRVS